MEIYRNIPRPPRCRAAGANLQKKEENKLRTSPWEPAARQPGDRPPTPPGSRAASPQGRPAAGRPEFVFAIKPFSRNNFTYVPFF